MSLLQTSTMGQTRLHYLSPLEVYIYCQIDSVKAILPVNILEFSGDNALAILSQPIRVTNNKLIETVLKEIKRVEYERDDRYDIPQNSVYPNDITLRKMLSGDNAFFALSSIDSGVYVIGQRYFMYPDDFMIYPIDNQKIVTKLLEADNIIDIPLGSSKRSYKYRVSSSSSATSDDLQPRSYTFPRTHHQ